MSRLPFNRLLHALAQLVKASILAIAILYPLAAAGESLALKRESSFAWLCAGVGAEERRALAGLQAQANIEILFVTVKRGGYLAGAELSLYPAKGAAPLLRVKADGPICLVSAPPGAYRLEARHAGETRESKALVKATNGRPARVVFAFPGEPWDGIWASAEEKSQARAP